jgi:hypothetical protein
MWEAEKMICNSATIYFTDTKDALLQITVPEFYEEILSCAGLSGDFMKDCGIELGENSPIFRQHFCSY